MKIISTDISGLVLVETTPYADHRGEFSRLFCEKELKEIIGERKIVQINHSMTREPGTVRGMHYQKPPYAEMKMVRCIRGRVWDVAVDLRTGSPTFLKWHAEELSDENSRMMIIPEGFAHGFQTLQDNSEIIYFVTELYNSDAEQGINLKDKKIKIKWPMPIINISEKDKNIRFLDEGYKGVKL